MADKKDIVKLAVDAYHGNVEKYSTSQAQEVLRQALIEANGGSTVLDYKAVRSGKCNEVFDLIEEILNVTLEEELTGNEFWNALVDYRNVAEGDKNLFIVKDATLFVVSEIAKGTQGIRRQRLSGEESVSIPTSVKAVRIYEELARVLSGRVDFSEMINKVGESFKRQLLNEIYAVWDGVSADQLGGVTYFPAAGSYDEDTLLDLISHVEAAAGGKQATIIGTKKALRNLKESIQGEVAKTELHSMGFYGYFFGTPCVAVPQRHKLGTTDFIMPDDCLTIIAGDEKPIKVVREGNPIMLLGDPMTNGDFTQEYFYAEQWGVGLVVAGDNSGIGRYEFTT